ncbi:16727_t:CDS:2 [Entrophospora sp. SA101]|nr:16727_t:CDS:2 [Entrophospora sp. SA101]
MLYSPEEKRKIILANYSCPSQQVELAELKKKSVELSTSFSTFRSLDVGCGDVLHLLIIIKGNYIEKCWFAGQQSCLITVAAANIICVCLEKKTIQFAYELINNCQSMIEGKEYDLHDCPDLQVFKVKKAVAKKFQHTSSMQTTDIEKIVLNSGVGQAINNKQFLENTEKALIQIAQGQKPILTYSHKSITAFKLREGMPIGCKVTLRKKRAWNFLFDLINFNLPLIANFQGFSQKKFDRDGNYNLGVDNLNIFSTVPYDLTFKNQGLQITIEKNSNRAELNILAAKTQKVLDKAVNKKIIHKNKAARKKSQLHKKPNETPLEAAKREVFEETNLIIEDLEIIGKQVFGKKNQGCMGYLIKANKYSGEIKIKEVEKIADIKFKQIDYDFAINRLFYAIIFEVDYLGAIKVQNQNVNKSYGPTTYGRVHTSRTSAWFSLEIGCYNCAGNEAADIGTKIQKDNYRELLNVDCTIAYRIRSKCAELIKDAIQKHERGQKVEGYVKTLFFVAFLVKVYLRRGYLFLTPKEKKEREELQNEFKSFQAREEHREHLKRGIDYDSKCSICSNT